jgi:hypothetical protein
MNKRILFFFILLTLIVNPANSQELGFGGFNDFGNNFANGIYTDVTKFTPGEPLGASDITVQIALQTINAFLQTDNLIAVLCAEGKINCIYDTLGDCPTTDRCFVYEDNVVKVYVNNVLQVQMPSVAVFDNLLLENGDFLLLEDGVSKLRLE